MKMNTKIRTYSELMKFSNFLDRFNYLKLDNGVGVPTFGFDRYLNQNFYRSYEWKKVRDLVILRDNGCDLGDPDRVIGSRVMIHHMNPVSEEDILERSDFLLNPEYLICVSHRTHNAIHFSNEDMLAKDELVVRKPNDTIPWR